MVDLYDTGIISTHLHPVFNMQHQQIFQYLHPIASNQLTINHNLTQPHKSYFESLEITVVPDLSCYFFIVYKIFIKIFIEIITISTRSRNTSIKSTAILLDQLCFHHLLLILVQNLEIIKTLGTYIKWFLTIEVKFEWIYRLLNDHPLE